MKIVVISEFNSYYGNEIVSSCHRRGIPINAMVYVNDRRDFDSLRIWHEYTNYVDGLRVVDIEHLFVPVHFVKSLNSQTTVDLLNHLAPDVIVQGGVGIIKKELIELPTVGIVNSHPGILPKYRGCMSVEWSIYNDDELGSTCHFIDESIDTGPIIHSETMEIRRGMSYHNVRLKSHYHQVETLVTGLEMIMNGFRKSDATPQGEGEYNKVMDRDTRIQVEDKINNGTYKHLK